MMAESLLEDCEIEKQSSPPTIEALEDLNISELFPIPKSRRTSRLTCGRRKTRGKTLTPNALPTADLCKSVPKTLPEHDRLAVLMEKAFDLCISKVADDLNNQNHQQNHLAKIVTDQAKCFENIKLYLNKSSVCKLILTDDKKWRDDASFSVYFNCMDKLKLESEKWDEEFLKVRENFKAVLNDPVKFDEGLVSDLNRKYAAYDYSDLLQETDDVIEEFMLNSNYLIQIMNSTDLCGKLLHNYHKHLNDHVCKQVFQETSETPRSLLCKNDQICLRNRQPL